MKSNSQTCGDLVCPGTLACVDDHCVDRTLLAACDGRMEGETCQTAQSGSGLCQDDVCIVGRCGDGTINGEEACDGLDLGGKTCLDFGGSSPGGLSCTSECAFDPSGCSEFCGNGHQDGTEQCDGSDFDQKSCVDYGFYGGQLACTSTCTVNLGGCAGKCGDGQIQQLEECDGTNLNGQTCATLGYNGDVVALSCTNTCSFAASSCTCGGALCAKNQTCVTNGGISSCQ
nr:hypothetical protein [Kofleriaceae bacterium]